MKNANDLLKCGYSSSNGNKLNTNNNSIYNSFNAKIINYSKYYQYSILKKDELIAAVKQAAVRLDNSSTIDKL